MKRTTKTIDKQCCKRSQSLDYVEVLVLGRDRIRIEIRSDSYKEQCYARCKLWSGGQWQLIHNIMPQEMTTPSELVYKKTAAENDFLKDRTRLLNVAEQVLFTN
jgi:hypothetical protein